MKEKRKRNATLLAKGLSAGEKLNRNRLLAECDLRWNWIGTEAKHVSEITRDHCLRAAGLALLGSKRPCTNKFVKRSISLPRQAPVSSTDPQDIIVISDGEDESFCNKKRCRDNPYCLNYMGQDKWEDEETAEEAYLKLALKREDPRSRSRGSNPVGLKNLGATCYANAFIQVWFQDLAFRSGVYRCQPSPNNRIKFKDSPIFQLQVTFTALQEGRLTVFNPIRLVESLRLRTTEQQDAQEFSKLFMSHLDDEFKKQSDPGLRSLISNQFEGKIVNATVCDKCKTRSERETPFLELEVNLEKNGVLEDRIASLLAPERLDENNKYLCSVCNGLQDATRYTEIRCLPPVLHISLLRFVYDLTTYERKKSKIPLKFPPYLNMKPFLQSADVHRMEVDDGGHSEIYELRGVLLHKGPSAYHGHYEAQVYNQEAKKWYQFNDEVVTPLASFYSPKPAPRVSSDPITIDDEEDCRRPSKRQKRATISRRVEDSEDEEEAIRSAQVKYLSSKDAYMLIYARREGPDLAITEPLIPPSDALEVVRSLNEAHEKACSEYDALKEGRRAEFMRTRDMMKDVYLSWNVTSAFEPSVIVSKTSLEDWLLSRLTQPEDMDDQEKINEEDVKEQSPDDKDSIELSHTQAEFPDELTMGSRSSSPKEKIVDSTNMLCPHDPDGQKQLLDPKRVKDMKVISKVAQDKLFQYGFSLKPVFTMESICRRCVEDEFSEKLYQLEHPRLVAGFNDISATASENEGFWISKAWLKDWQLNKPRIHVPSQPDPSPENVSDDPALNFRSHVYCKHDCLSINVGTRRRISLQAVQLLQQLYEGWNPPPWNAETCPACDVDVHVSKESKLEQRKKAENEKALFYRLNNGDVFGHQGLSQNSICSIVPSDFVRRWRKWLVKPGDADRPTNIDTQSMLCDHGKLVLDLTDKADLDNDIAALTMPEWDRLQAFYDTGPLIKVECLVGNTESGQVQRKVISELPCCADCRTKRKLDFLSATLTIIHLDRVLDPARTTSQKQSKDTSNTASTTTDSKAKSFPLQSDGSYSGRTNGVRQSRRLQEGRYSDRQQIEVQRDWTVKDIKVAVYKAFKIPTISQRLYYHGVELNDNSKTVAELKILNKDTLHLRESAEDMIVLDSDEDEQQKKPKKRAEGNAFKGTVLGWSSPPSADKADPDHEVSAVQKACSTCTLLNPPEADRCEACESFL